MPQRSIFVSFAILFIESVWLCGVAASAEYPKPRYSGVVFPSGSPDSFFISGGAQTDKDNCLTDLFRYNIPENRWESVAPKGQMLPPVNAHSSVAIGDKVFFFGGTYKGYNALTNDLFMYDQKTGRFSKIDGVKGDVPSPRFVHGACADDKGRMWIFGGLTYGNHDLNEIYCYDPGDNRWRKIEDKNRTFPGPRHGAPLLHYKGSLYVFGGFGPGGRLGDLNRFDIDAETWHRLQKSKGEIPSPRFIHSFFVVGDLIYLFAGKGQGGQAYLNDLYVYDPAADKWQKLAPRGDVPSPRTYVLPICLDGRRVYLFSAWQPQDEYGLWVNADLYCYDTQTNAFTLMQKTHREDKSKAREEE